MNVTNILKRNHVLHLGSVLHDSCFCFPRKLSFLFINKFLKEFDFLKLLLEEVTFDQFIF